MADRSRDRDLEKTAPQASDKAGTTPSLTRRQRRQRAKQQANAQREPGQREFGQREAHPATQAAMSRAETEGRSSVAHSAFTPSPSNFNVKVNVSERFNRIAATESELISQRQRWRDRSPERRPTLPEVTPGRSPRSRQSDLPREPRRAPSSPSRKRNTPRSPLAKAGFYLLRLLILGIGLGVIGGSMLSTWNLVSQSSPMARPVPSPTRAIARTSPPSPDSSPLKPSEIRLGQTLPTLTKQIRSIAADYSGLTPSVFLLDLDTNEYVDINSNTAVAAASTIKVPILMAFFQDVDAGKIRLNEALTMKAEQIASGSGDMQDQPAGTQFTAWETARRMIVISDNTATNMLIDRLGGIAALNQRFREWGLTHTVIRNPLPDLEGTNTTSVRDMALLMAWVHHGDLLQLRSRDRALDIMQRTENQSLLPSGLGESGLISHKTGDIGTSLGDVGLVTLANGKRYAIAIMVKRPHNDYRAQDLIQRASKAAYTHLSKPLVMLRPSPPTPRPASASPAAGRP